MRVRLALLVGMFATTVHAEEGTTPPASAPNGPRGPAVVLPASEEAVGALLEGDGIDETPEPSAPVVRGEVPGPASAPSTAPASVPASAPASAPAARGARAVDWQHAWREENGRRSEAAALVLGMGGAAAGNVLFYATLFAPTPDEWDLPMGVAAALAPSMGHWYGRAYGRAAVSSAVRGAVWGASYFVADTLMQGGSLRIGLAGAAVGISGLALYAGLSLREAVDAPFASRRVSARRFTRQLQRAVVAPAPGGGLSLTLGW